jgi:hypothetical protein
LDAAIHDWSHGQLLTPQGTGIEDSYDYHDLPNAVFQKPHLEAQEYARYSPNESAFTLLAIEQYF